MKMPVSIEPVCALLLFIPFSAFAQLTTNEIVQRVSSSVVTIEGELGTGSGVVLDSDGVVVTNFHVIEGENELSIELANGDIYKDVSVIDYDLSKDIALLKIKAFDIPFSVMGNSNPVSVGDDVVIIGSPRGLSQSVTRGIISAKRDSGDGFTLFQTDAAISPGSSGGGMFNTSGELVGVVVSKLTDAENVNFVIPINYVTGMYSDTPQYELSEISRINQDDTSSATLAANSQDLSSLLSRTNLSFSDAGDGVWYTDYEADGLVERVASYVAGENVITVGFPELDESSLSLDTVKEFLSMNYKFNYVKIGIEEEGDLVVLNETSLEHAIPATYEDVVRNVAALTMYLELTASTVSNSENKAELAYPGGRGLEKFELINNNADFSLNTDLWKSDPSLLSGGDNIEENAFAHKDGQLWFKVIAEAPELNYELMRDSILENAQSVSPEAKITNYGFRIVNGKELMWVYLEGAVEDIPMKYFYHVYTGEEGTYQLIAITFTNLMGDYEAEIEKVVSTFRVN